MSPLSFAYVPPSGFAAFATTLSSNPWALVDASAYNDPAKPLWDTLPLVVAKIRIQRSVHSLVVTIVGSSGAKGCDRNWDSCEKQLGGLLGVHAVSLDPAKRDAAKRLQSALLLGNGEAQTLLRYQEEVDFGRKQVAMVASGQMAADVALLGLGPMMNEIAVATEALANVIGHGESTAAPYERQRKAVAKCAATFAAVAESLEWFIAASGDAPERTTAVALHASLKELAARYPAPVRTKPAKETAPASVH